MFSYIKYKARGEIQRLPQIVMVADLSNCHSTVVWPIKNSVHGRRRNIFDPACFINPDFTNFVISLYGKYHQLILAQFGLVPPIY
jgi:hypothetical protein